MSIHTGAYHVLVPSTMVYEVEADSEEEAAQLVWAAIAPRYYGLAATADVTLIADKTTQTPPPYDVEDPADHGECGCDQCVNHYDHD
jgi:hypothetical protein